MKLKYIILTVTSVIVVAGGGLIYSGHSSQNANVVAKSSSTAKSYTSTSNSSVMSSSSSSESDTVTASGANYQIATANGMGGVLAKLTPITKIIDKQTALDIVASIPNFNNYHLISIEESGDAWKIRSQKDNAVFLVTMSHYTDNLCLISVEDGSKTGSGYSFRIPENLYAPYRDADKKLTEDFTKSLNDNKSENKSDLTDDEAVALANKYVTGSKGANTTPFKSEMKNDNVWLLKTDVKKGTNGTPDIATYATVEPSGNGNVHITAGVWSSTMANHAPFYDEIVSR
ncbi:hypothetical protein AB3K25_00250 [Leuconostoc sp. MS02]|uniref:Uncharacterized protein n=1 Tax=Leuconostoc aquikimchii TaxID=3236804 RepID=A0ABV3S595_9LACO